jgi:hypothetical protein
VTVPTHIADILSRLGRIEGKLDSFSTTVIAQMKVQDDRTTGIEVRTRKVENRQHWYSGAGAILGAVLGAVGVHVKT